MREYYCKAIIDCKTEPVYPEEARMDVLYITSDSELAEQLLRRGAAVLAVISEGAGEDWGGAPYACQDPEVLDRDYCEMIYRRFRDIPWEISQTERMIIRETTLQDVEAFWEIYKDPDITKYTEGLYPTLEQEQDYQREYIEKVYKFYGVGIWTLEDRDTGEILGRAGLTYRTFGDDYAYGDCPELGFVIAKEHQRKGLGQEACSEIIAYAIRELECTGVTALVQPDNLASVELCRRLGMRDVGEVMLGEVLHRIMYIAATPKNRE